MKILTPNAKYAFELDDSLLEQADLKDSMQVVKEAWVENVYQIQASDFWDTGIFIDVGANIGAVSLQVAAFNDDRDRSLKPIKVIAYEPEPHNLKFLDLNVRTNSKVGEVKIHQKAIMPPTSNRYFYVSNRGGNSTVHANQEENTSKVEVSTLEEIFTDNKISECDVMKIDIEGAEYEVLLESDTRTLQRIKYLALEFTGHKDSVYLQNNPESFGKLIEHLAEVFNLHIIGKPSTGGYIYGRRY